MTPPRSAHDAFRRRLVRFVDRPGVLGTRSRGAQALVQSYHALPPVSSGASRTVSVPGYAGSNPNVLALRADLDRWAGDDLVGAYVHGSLGSDEEVAYSDFDALVVLADAAFASPSRLGRVAGRLSRARRHMVAHDPLQHHGWFVATESDLAAWPEAYLPSAVLKRGASLLDRGRTLSLSPSGSAAEFRAGFDTLAQSVIEPIERGWRPSHLYALKAFLSRFMLVPALYVQARDGRGVWKGDSFDLARGDVDDGLWHAMDRVSAIRQSWATPIGGAQRYALTRPGALGDEIRKRLPVRIPVTLASQLDEGLFNGMATLAHALVARLDAPSCSHPATAAPQLHTALP